MLDLSNDNDLLNIKLLYLTEGNGHYLKIQQVGNQALQS